MESLSETHRHTARPPVDAAASKHVLNGAQVNTPVLQARDTISI